MYFRKGEKFGAEKLINLEEKGLVCTYKNSSGIENHAFKWAMFNILAVVSYMNSPFSGLMRLK